MDLESGERLQSVWELGRSEQQQKQQPEAEAAEAADRGEGSHSLEWPDIVRANREGQPEAPAERRKGWKVWRQTKRSK